MDWTRAIAINQAALVRVVASLFAMLEMAGGVTAARLPPSLHRAVSQVLRPAESAVRRLIIIAARGLVAKLPPIRPMPQGLAFAATGNGRVSFQLFDARQRLLPSRAAATVVPRIHYFDASPLVPLFQPRPGGASAPEPDRTISALRLGRRLAALQTALGNLPAQAKRLARWRARRDRMQRPLFRLPLRPGPPPGHRKRPIGEIDWILKECHALARDALSEDSS